MCAWGPFALRAANKKNRTSQCKSCRCRLNLPERLENRLLMTATPSADDSGTWVHSAGICTCPVCTGIGLDQIPTAVVSSTDPSAAVSLASLPQLSSRPGAAAKLYLDFNGNYESTWGSWSNVSTPVYDQDGDATTFSDGELASIYEIWARVAEDYAPFNIDVTTINPGSNADKVVARIAIGGNSSDWYGAGAGGVAYVGGFYNGAPNVGFVFEESLANGTAKYVAEAASHEAGHLFGLQHQSSYSGTTKTEEYNTGNGSWAPIMGVGYYAPRTTWHNGANTYGSTSYQDDMTILAGSSNGFGYRADDVGSTRGTAAVLPVSGSSVNVSGLIGRSDDLDVWSFTTGGGNVSFQLTVAAYGANLDSVLEVWDANGTVIASSAPGDSQGASLSASVGAGTFYVVARGMGDYGDVGQYTLSGSLTTTVVTNPEIQLAVSGVNLESGGVLSFGSTNVGTAVTRTVTVTNQGNGPLTLNSLAGIALPPGFSLVANLGKTTLNAGESTTFTLQLNAASAGSFAGVLTLVNNDADEGQFTISLSGTAVAVNPEIQVLVGGVNLDSGGVLNFGATTVGTAVTRILTVTNQGNGPLTLSSLAGVALPPGFSLVADFGKTTLAAGESTTFSLRFDATSSAGSFSGTLVLVNNDTDEGQYAIGLNGSATVPVQSVVRIVDDGDAGYTKNGTWKRSTGKGYAKDISTAVKGYGSYVSSWSFSSLPAGEYKVYATWTAGSKNASNAPYTVLEGGTTLASVRVSQRTAPGDLIADGARWKLLATVTVSSGQLVVKLTNSANGPVVADAVRIEQVVSAGTPPARSFFTSAATTAAAFAGAPLSVFQVTVSPHVALGGSDATRPSAHVASVTQGQADHTAIFDEDFAAEQQTLDDVLDLLAEVRRATSQNSESHEGVTNDRALGRYLSALV